MRSPVSRHLPDELHGAICGTLDHEERIPWFTNASQTDPELPYGPLLRYVPTRISCVCIHRSPSILDSQDDFVQLKAAQILTVLLRSVILPPGSIHPSDLLVSSEKSPLQPQQLQPFLNTLSLFVSNNSPNKRDVAVQCLEAVLARPECRKAVWANTSLVLGSANSHWQVDVY